MTNDTKKPTVLLNVSGPVIKFVKIAPVTIQLRGEQGDAITGSSTITPIADYPFTILSTTTSPNAKFTHSLEKVAGGPETGWLLTVTDPDPQGRYSGTVFLHTDSKAKPKLEVRVYGNFMGKKTTTINKTAPKDK